MFMCLKFWFSACLLMLSLHLSAQPVIYNDATTLITGTWASAGSNGTANIQEVTTASPYEGTKHYKLDYNYSNWWAGFGLNMDNWGSGPARNFSGYNYLRLAYRGMISGQTLSIQLRNGSNFGNQVTVGSTDPNYALVTIPISALVQGSSVNASAVTEIILSVGAVQNASGTVYIDAIELTNNSGLPSGYPANATTWARANALGVGVNTANWLEAFWLLPFGTFPEVNKYNRTNIQALRNAGFTSIRLPITVERISPTTPPYTINFNQPAFRLVDSMILWAQLFDFKLIIDNHHGYELTNANYMAELPRLKALWGQLATRYGNLDPERYYFELYNEATPSISNANFRTVATALVAEIRANEAVRHAVIVGASGWNSGIDLSNFAPLADSNIIYTFHNYDPYPFTHQGMSWTSPPNMPAQAFPLPGQVAYINDLFSAVKTWSNTHNVPVFLGEYGNSTSADAVSRCNHVQTITGAATTNGFPYFYWDAISPSDAFGFFSGGVVSQANAIPCFATAIGLYSPPLAVNLLSFEVVCEGRGVDVFWEASASDAGTAYALQTSADDRHWVTTAKVMAGEGVHRVHDDAPGLYYRLQITEPDGRVYYSPVKPIPCSHADALLLYPQPASQVLYLQSKSVWQSLVVFDVHGRLVFQLLDEQTDQIDLRGFDSGTYYLRATDTRGNMFFRQFTVVR